MSDKPEQTIGLQLTENELWNILCAFAVYDKKFDMDIDKIHIAWVNIRMRKS